jgi:hypothetical protein
MQTKTVKTKAWITATAVSKKNKGINIIVGMK